MTVVTDVHKSFEHKCVSECFLTEIKTADAGFTFEGTFVLRLLLALSIPVEFSGCDSNVTGSSNPWSLEVSNSGLSIEHM